MEKAIDRTEYRRGYRNIANQESKKPKKKYTILNMFLNQMIVSLLIIVTLFTLKYFDITKHIDWVKANLKSDIQIVNVAEKVKEIINQNFKTRSVSGEIVDKEPSSESGYITAVEGINQIRDDAIYIKENFDLVAPTIGIITSKFGCRKSDDKKISSYHAGLDIANTFGTQIVSAHDGVVVLAQEYGTYGNCVMIKKENLITLYAHCSSILVSKGDEVQKGNPIAKMGMTGNATGPHLHFEIRYEDRYVDPESVFEEYK